MKWIILLISIVLLHHLNDGAESHRRKKRVVGGFFSSAGLFPFIVSLRLGNENAENHFCGGSILSSRYIISSAHCMILQPGAADECYRSKYVGPDTMKHKIIALAGTTSLDSAYGKTYEIESYIYHSDFNFKLGTNDISLLRTSSSIIFSKYIQPIALHRRMVPVGASVLVAGWGLTSYPGKPSNILKFIDLRTISYDDCARWWKKVYYSQLCTFTTAGEGVCTSDSGGPLIYNEELVGLVSFGKPCAIGYPDVFTNVTHMIPWVFYNVACLSITL